MKQKKKNKKFSLVEQTILNDLHYDKFDMKSVREIYFSKVCVSHDTIIIIYGIYEKRRKFVQQMK